MSDVIAFGILGLASGALYVLFALGLVIIHRGAGVVNFAHGAVGMVGTFVFWDLWHDASWPYGLALVIGVLTSGAIGVLVHFTVMRPLRLSAQLTRIIATLAILTILEQAATKLYSGPSIVVASKLPTSTVKIFGATVGADRIYILVGALVLAALLGWIYRYTQFGRATTAANENRRALAALGWSSDLIASTNWFVGSALAGLAGILLAPISNLSITGYTLLVVPALAAAVTGRLASFPLTLIGGLVIGVIQSEVNRYVSAAGWADAVPFLIMILVLVLRGSDEGRRTSVAIRLPSIGTGRLRWPVVLGWVAGAIVLIELVPAKWNDSVTTTVGIGLILLSVVVVTGYSGQLSLAQFGFAGFGAWVAAQVANTGDVPILVAILIGAAAALPLGVVVGTICLRTRGVSLAIATLGMAVALDALIFSNPARSDEGSLAVPEPHLFGWDIGAIIYPERYAILIVVVFAICAVATANLRRGRSGRRLIAIRSNERAAAAMGIPVLQGKVVAFAISSVIAALGGALLAFRNPTILFSGYDASQSINVVGYAVVGGVGWLAGPLYGGQLPVGSLASTVLDEFGSTVSSYLPLAGGVLLLLVLITSPDGMAAHAAGQLRAFGRLLRRAPKPPATPDLTLHGEHRVQEQALELSGISVAFGGVKALSDVSLRVAPGEIVGLIGPNGAGKTTLIDAATGFVRVSAGSIHVGSRSVTRMNSSARARAGLSRSFQSLELFDDLSVLDNLRAASERRDLKAFALDAVRPTTSPLTPATRAAIARFGLEPYLHKTPTELPYGVRRLVAVARAVSTEASVVALDEPAAGLDEAAARELGRLLRQVADEWGMGVLLVEHNVELVMSLCDRIYALDFGVVIASGTAAEVRTNPEVVRSYLGADDTADTDLVQAEAQAERGVVE